MSLRPCVETYQMMVIHEAPKYRYRIDEFDRILWVDPRWLAFAQENGASALIESAVVGHSLWDFIAGATTRNLFAAIHQRVRSTGEPAVLPFRCDSPHLKRHMRLTISREPSGTLAYESVLIRAEPSPYANLLDTDQPRSECILTICSCCRRALLESVGWLEVEDVSARLKIFDAPEVPEIRYDICPDCALVPSHAK